MKRVKMISVSTGAEMLVAENRVAEYEKLGHKKAKAAKNAAGKDKTPDPDEMGSDAEAEQEK